MIDTKLDGLCNAYPEKSLIRAGFFWVSVTAFAALMPAWTQAATHKPGETMEETACRLVEQAAQVNHLSTAVLTRLLWSESRLQTRVVSQAGAQGIAQFMPSTAGERGLSDPFDPNLAIPEAAKLLAEFGEQFGNIGLAVAAYNAGPGRITNWLEGSGNLSDETWRLVFATTGKGLDEWVFTRRSMPRGALIEPLSCLELLTGLVADRADERERSVRGRPYALLPGMEQSGLMLPGMKQSGRMLPGMKRSGSALPIVQGSGAMLMDLREDARPRWAQR